MKDECEQPADVDRSVQSSTRSAKTNSKMRGKLLVLSNRGPMQWQEGRWVRSSGGLVTALDPLLRQQQGIWVSAHDAEPDEPLPDVGYRQELVVLPESVKKGFYSGFSNGVLWPTLHGFPSIRQIDDAPWEDYEAANRAFAEAALAHTEEGDLLWVHDYHLMRTPLLLKNTQPDLRIGWFCHIPWPDPDQFATLPWRRDLLQGLLGATVLGFHSARYVAHFLECVSEFTEASVNRSTKEIVTAEGMTRLIVAPIGIPTRSIGELVDSSEVREREASLRRDVEGRRIILGVDRLDYTKGIVERLSAFARLLERRPNLVDELQLVQVVIPSRETVEAYTDLKEQIDRLVGQINGQFSRAGRVPIHYIYGSLAPAELYAHYRAADVALVTPLRDGMNLVALEYIASRSRADGALVLSEFAGAAEHLDQAYLVNPYDIENIAEQLERALEATPEEATKRMHALRAVLSGLDVHVWADGFLAQLQASTPSSRQLIPASSPESPGWYCSEATYDSSPGS